MFWFSSLLFGLVSAQCIQKPCIEIIDTDSVTGDKNDIVASGFDRLMWQQTAFASSTELFMISSSMSSVTVQSKTPLGKYASRGLAFGGFSALSSSILVFVVPDASPSHMHILQLQNGVLSDAYTPIALPKTPPGHVFTTATPQVDQISGAVQSVRMDLFFFCGSSN